MEELVLLKKGYEIRLNDVQRELDRELAKISTEVIASYGYTVLNGQEIAFLQGKKAVLVTVIREIDESIEILKNEKE